MTKIKLGDILQIKNGKKYDFLSPEKTPKYQTPVYGTGGIMGYTEQKLFSGESILLPRKGSLANIMLTSGDIWTVDTIYYTEVDESKVNIKFLFYYLSILNLSYLDSGSTIPSMTMGAYNNLEINLPPLSAQKKVAEILGALDEKIALNRQTNQTLESLATTLFQKTFLASPEKEKWKEKSLDEIAEFLNGLAMQKYPKIEGKPTLPVIKIREMTSGITDNTDIANAEIPSQCIVNDGDLLFSWSGTLIVKFWFGGQGALNQHLFKVTSEKYPEWFVYLWLQHHLAEFIRIAKSKATTMGHIQRQHLKNAKVLIPPAEELRELDVTFAPLISQQKALSVETQTLTTLRTTLLPKLISGEIRLT
jgi:type I restriction enzyme S subunit